MIAFTLFFFPVSPFCMQIIVNVHEEMCITLHAICCVSRSEWRGGIGREKHKEGVYTTYTVLIYHTFSVTGLVFGKQWSPPPE